jgi:hypothetical protein
MEIAAIYARGLKLFLAKECIGHAAGKKDSGQGLFPGPKGKQAALGFFPEALAYVRGIHFDLADFVRHGEEGKQRLVKTAAQKFYLLAGDKIPDQKKKFGLFLLKPFQEGAGKMKHRLDIFLRVKTGDKGLKPFVVQFLEGAISRSGGKVFMIAQYQAGFSGHNPFSVR